MKAGNKSFDHAPRKQATALEDNNAATWRHFWRHLWMGLALCGVLTLGAIAYKLLSAETYYELTKGAYTKTDFVRLANDCTWLGIMFLICSGTAAALGGLLRHKYLIWLSQTVRSRNKLVWGSLIGFELSVLLAAILYWWITGAMEAGHSKQALGYTAMVCFAVSLPWLLATSWASWRLATELRMPLHEDASPPSV